MKIYYLPFLSSFSMLSLFVLICLSVLIRLCLFFIICLFVLIRLCLFVLIFLLVLVCFVRICPYLFCPYLSLKVYEKMPEIQAMVNLRAAYERGDIIEMEKILRFYANTMLDDPFISMM